MKPLIGITSTRVKLHEYSEGVYVHRDYHRAVEASGGLPIVLPLASPDTFRQLIDLCDGIIFTGGEDVEPAAYGEEPVPELGTTLPERDRLELEAIRYVVEADKPLFAICRGVQVLNVAFGGTLYQDLPSQYAGALEHVQRGAPRGEATHSVNLAEDSYVRQIAGRSQLQVNSLHHQALRRIGPGLTVTATSPDGVVEAVEYKDRNFVIGVQWHPESLFDHDEVTQKLFREFVARSREQAERR
ncbi:gamma-glutamyl-gamma-aminobutyrate hydrolase family protein [Paenibacillus filicis]|uniref:Gamma-glutamyl-gamma-aminobutyrate hydrolase family protein n=1 Tax=Paenibacillus filicis TaxID=669464 RepID=A0ABU9DGK9_9BACL